MPDWQIVSDAYARLQHVRAMLDSAVNEAIREANAGALPVLELLAAEAERHTCDVLDALRNEQNPHIRCQAAMPASPGSP